MHIEPGLIAEPKLVLSYATGATALAFGGWLALDEARARGAAPLAARAAAATALVVVFFEVLPHVAVGVSEVHLILGSVLLLALGTAPAAIGLAAGLLAQGLLMAPADLPQYGANVTTLLVPLFAVAALTPRGALAGLRGGQVLRLALTYQAGIVAWVAFWALWGQGATAGTLAAIASFGAAQAPVVAIEAAAALALLAAARARPGLPGLASPRLRHPA